MIPIEEQSATPDIDRLLVLRCEVVIQANEQELLDLRVPVRLWLSFERSGGVGPERIRHGSRVRERADYSIPLPLQFSQLNLESGSQWLSLNACQT
jgi:hypothetical protein